MTCIPNINNITSFTNSAIHNVLTDTGNVSVTLKYPLGPFMCMAEQLVINLQALQRLRLQEKVPASDNIGG